MSQRPGRPRAGVRREPNRFLSTVQIGIITVRDVVEAVLGDIEQPDDEARHFGTLAVFVISRIDRIPQAADKVTWNGWNFEVMNMDEHRVDKVR
ncbi:MAG: transporter associated domain-containing protein [Chloroflexota bacterium]